MNSVLSLFPDLPETSKSPLPPMLQQYVEYKQRFNDCLIFFQVGDFYELFFEDAITVAKNINLTLTSRDKNSPNPIPMCGVPISVADQYCDRLVTLGFSVAIISQVGSATGKGMVARKLERIITPAIQVSAASQSENYLGYLAAVYAKSNSECAVAYSEVQTRRAYVKDGISIDELPSFLKQISASEVIINSTFDGKAVDKRFSWIKSIELIVKNGNIKFRNISSVESFSNITGFSSLSPTAKQSVALLSSYIDEVTIENGFSINQVETSIETGLMSIDATTRANLELVKNSRDGTVIGSLFEYLNATSTPGGLRFLRQQLIAPPIEIKTINNRLELVESFLNDHDKCYEISNILKLAPDLERIASRIELQNISPKELGALRDFFENIPKLVSILETLTNWSFLSKDHLSDINNIFELLNETLVKEPPFILSEGGYINPNSSNELFELINIQTNSQEVLAKMEADERAKTNIPSLKIKYTSVFGYFIEVSNAHLSKIPPHYTRKQTTTNSERFITPDLKEKETLILNANEKRIELEKKIFSELKTQMTGRAGKIREIYANISNIDFINSLALVSAKNRLTKPKLVEESKLEIVDGKHPQISAILKEKFIPNDCQLDSKNNSTWIITGPNMGGKSTYLRQIALITIMAHLGSFVPAKSALIGITDKVFARLGASDNLAEGESTFMVEMRETSNLLKGATEKSLLIIDEIGRGTSTKDGLALAQSILEWTVTKTKSRTLFATHFHEITELEAVLSEKIKNVSVGSIMQEGELIFTHRIEPGAATKSFGIEVAKRAGLPTGVVTRAKNLLLSKKSEDIPKTKSEYSKEIFQEPELKIEDSELFNALKNIEPDLLTPKEALEKIYFLKSIIEKNK